MSNSYKIGQMVLEPERKYLESIDINEKGFFINADYSLKVFEDFYIKLDSPLENTKNYYLNIGVEGCKDNDCNINIKIIQRQENDGKIESLKSRVVKENLFVAKDSNNFYSIIFNPIEKDYDTIVLEIIRDNNDFQVTEEGKIGRILGPVLVDENKQEIFSFSSIVNLLKDESYIVTELGLQGEPGQLFTIEGEEFRIGKSGVYEMHFENIGINNIGVIPQENTLILDYKYKEAK